MPPKKTTSSNDPAAEVRSLTKRIAPLYDDALSLTVQTPAQYEGAGQMLLSIKGRAREVEDTRKAITRPLDEAKKGVMALFRPLDTQLAEMERAVKRSMLAYQSEEAERIQAEQAALDAKAEKLRAKGKTAQAEALVEMSPVAEPARVSGVSTRVMWKADVTDLLALVKAVAAGDVPLDFLLPNMEKLNAIARTGKGEWGLPPGVTAVSETVMAASRG